MVTWRTCLKTRRFLLVLLLGLSLLQSIHTSIRAPPATQKLNTGAKFNQPSNNIVWKVGADPVNAFTTFQLKDTQTFFDSYWINASDSNNLPLTITIDALYFGTNITFIPQGDPTGTVTINLFLNGAGQPIAYYVTSTSYDSKNDVYTVKRPADNNPVILLWIGPLPSKPGTGASDRPPSLPNLLFTVFFSLPYALPGWTLVALSILLPVGYTVRRGGRRRRRRGFIPSQHRVPILDTEEERLYSEVPSERILHTETSSQSRIEPESSERRLRSEAPSEHRLNSQDHTERRLASQEQGERRLRTEMPDARKIRSEESKGRKLESSKHDERRLKVRREERRRRRRGSKSEGRRIHPS